MATSLFSGEAAAASARLCALHYRDDVSRQEILAAHRDWAARYARPHYPRRPVRPLDPSPQRPLRIGYLSGDLRRHPVSFFVEPLLRCHDRAGFRLFCYDNGGEQDDLNRHLRSLVPDWRAIDKVDDETVARQIRADRIDILVDLNGHTARNRLLVFARKPAPLQMTAIGYVGTTGLETIDYRLTDGWCDPEGEAEAFHSEALLRLEGGFNCYAPPRGLPEPGPLPCLENGHVTFGCFNNLDKITDRVLDTWAKLLATCEGSRLILKTKDLGRPEVRRRILERFASQGVAAERLELIEWTATLAEHFALYRRLDIALDPFPYNGTTTTCEALMMGLPVVTLAGESHGARVSAGILQRIGLSSLAAETPESYVARAVMLTARLDALSRLRANLRRQLFASPLCDAAGYTRRLEAAYREIWRKACLRSRGRADAA